MRKKRKYRQVYRKRKYNIIKDWNTEISDKWRKKAKRIPKKIQKALG